MTSWDLLRAFGEVDAQMLRRADPSRKAGPTGWMIVKKTVKFAAVTAAVVLVAGFIFVAWYLQTYYGVRPDAAASGDRPPAAAQDAEETPAREPLRIVVDVDRSVTYGGVDGEDAVRRFLREAQYYAKVYGGPDDLEDCVVDAIPASGVERETALTRVATEIMSGNPPDLFICRAGEDVWHGEIGPTAYDYSPALFPFVERQMEEGFFLPLDEYLETARFMDWDDLVPTVMAGGRNSTGEQVILPMTFTLPLTFYAKEDTPDFPGETTWDDVVQSEDPFLVNTASWASSSVWYDGHRFYYSHTPQAPYFSRLFPRLADYGKGAPGFSEEDLLRRTEEALALRQRVDLSVLPFQSCMGTKYMLGTHISDDAYSIINGLERVEQTMVPLYGIGGGAVADITTYCAVSSATKRPDDAFFLCDLLLSEDFQKAASLYALLATTSGIMPTHQRLAAPGNQFFGYGFALDANHEEWLRVCGQITAARVPNELDNLLSHLLMDLSLDDIGIAIPQEQEIDPAAVTEAVHGTYRKIQRILDES